MGLRLSEEKTAICHIDQGFDFLGYAGDFVKAREQFLVDKQENHSGAGSVTSAP